MKLIAFINFNWIIFLFNSKYNQKFIDFIIEFINKIYDLLFEFSQIIFENLISVSSLIKSSDKFDFINYYFYKMIIIFKVISENILFNIYSFSIYSVLILFIPIFLLPFLVILFLFSKFKSNNPEKKGLDCMDDFFDSLLTGKTSFIFGLMNSILFVTLLVNYFPEIKGFIFNSFIIGLIYFIIRVFIVDIFIEKFKKSKIN